MQPELSTASLPNNTTILYYSMSMRSLNIERLPEGCRSSGHLAHQENLMFTFRTSSNFLAKNSKKYKRYFTKYSLWLWDGVTIFSCFCHDTGWAVS